MATRQEILTAVNSQGQSMFKYPANETLKRQLMELEEKGKIHFDTYFLTWKAGRK